MSNVTVLHAVPVDDGYSHRDVIADGDGILAQRAPMPGQWLRFGERYETPADQLPQPWVLVCRAGEVTDLVRARQAYVDIEGQNAVLFAALEWLASLDDPEHLEERRTLTLDQIVQSAKRALVVADPLRGGE
jgi:hypothetical protein